jgi:hypothetical protein
MQANGSRDKGIEMKSSENIATLASALVKAQKAFAPAVKAKSNPAFKGAFYVDLASAIDAAQPALLDNDIAVIQGTAGDIAQQSITVTTRIIHGSGEWIEESLTLPALNRGDFSAQSAGSAITYARRYSYMAILGFAPEDDDGNAASGKGPQQDTQRAVKPFTPASADIDYHTQMQRDSRRPDAPEPSDADDDFDAHMAKAEKQPQVRKPGPVISPAQAKRFFGIAMGSGKSKQEINNYLAIHGYGHTEEIIKPEYEQHCEWAASK